MTNLIYSPGEPHATLTNGQARTIERHALQLFRALEDIRAAMLDTSLKAHQRAGKMDEIASRAVRMIADAPDEAEMKRRQQLTAAALASLPRGRA